jgi:hypothetical protein
MHSFQRNYARVGALLGWGAVLVQLYLFLDNRTTSVGETLIRFFSYFTILSNIAVSCCFSSYFIKGRWHRFFSSPQTLTAVTVYILVVGMVYNAVLRQLWQPEGIQKMVDEILHSVNPLLLLIFWILYVPKQLLQWKDALPAIVFPLVYTLFIALRGAVSGFYPYPFINVTQLGYPKVLMNGCLLMVVFLGLSLVLTAIAKLASRR